MPDPLVTDMTHFLTPDGRIAIRSGTLAKFLGAIVEATTARGSGSPSGSSLRCRRRPGHRPCGGVIESGIDGPTNEILWRCIVCGDRGSISNWQHTPWDRSSASQEWPQRGLLRRPRQWTPAARRAWNRVPPRFRLKILNNVWCITCRSGTSIALKSASVQSGNLVLQGQCTRCGGDVARVVEVGASPG